MHPRVRAHAHTQHNTQHTKKQGFLPEAVDAFVMDYLYPSYTPTMLGFLAASSLYGAFKVGKLPGQEQPPPT